MKKRFPTSGAIGLALVLAIALALVSVFIERTGPGLAEYGNLCGATGFDPCYQPVLKGGFPVAYLYDAPGISVEHRLSFGEDQLLAGALLLDVVIYFAAAMLAVFAGARWRPGLRTEAVE